jgi:disulfide bond formation protein DsbB
MLAPPQAEGAPRLKRARLLALLLPSGLLGGALFSQYVGGLYPCEMCYWQRWPHAVAILLAIGAYFSASNRSRSRTLVMLAALAVAISGAIGVFHAGVEMGWWEGITQCTATGATSLQDILNVPLVRCDQVQWDFLGISMAGWNAIISLLGAAVIVALARRSA